MWPVRAKIVVGILLWSVTACHSTSATSIGAAPEALAASIQSRGQPVAGIMINPDKVLLRLSSTSESTSVTVWPDGVADDTLPALPAVPPANYPLDTEIARAKELAGRCSDSWQFSSAVAGPSAVLSIEKCGQSGLTHLNDVPLEPVTDPFTTAALSQLWSEVEQVAPDGVVRQLMLSPEQFTATMADRGSLTCPVHWSRGLSDPTASFASCEPGPDTRETFSLGTLDPDEVSQAITQGRTQFSSADTDSFSVLVSSMGGTVHVTVSAGTQQTTIEIGS